MLFALNVPFKHFYCMYYKRDSQSGRQIRTLQQPLGMNNTNLLLLFATRQVYLYRANNLTEQEIKIHIHKNLKWLSNLSLYS